MRTSSRRTSVCKVEDDNSGGVIRPKELAARSGQLRQNCFLILVSTGSRVSSMRTAKRSVRRASRSIAEVRGQSTFCAYAGQYGQRGRSGRTQARYLYGLAVGEATQHAKLQILFVE